MRVTLVSTVSGAANGGTAAYIRSLGNELANAGHSVSGLSRLHRANERGPRFGDSDVSDPDLGGGISFEGWQNGFIGPSKAIRPLLALLHHLMSRPRFHKLATLLFHTAYKAALDRKLPAKTEVVHYVGAGSDLLGFSALSAARRRSAKFTITPFVHPNQWADSVLDVRLYRRSDAVFVCSTTERDHLLERGVGRDRLQLTGMAPSGILPADPMRFRCQHGLGERPLILFLARKQRYKGYHVLLRAMKDIIAAIPDVCLVAAGSEGELPYPSISKEHFLDLGELSPSPQDAQQKADVLSACDVFCMPSTAEAFGLVYAEAWHYGKPVIGGMAPALQELIVDGVNGFRVEQDERQLAGRLIQLLQDGGLRHRMGQEGHRIQQEKYTWEAVLRRHLQIWADLGVPAKNS